MKQNIVLFCMFSFSLQTVCMMTIGKRGWSDFENQQKQSVCGELEIPLDTIDNVVSNLDYKSNTRFIMTSKTLYVHYKDKDDILCTHHYLNSDNYMDAMIYFSRKNDAKKIRLLMEHEGSINKKNREEIYECHWKNPCSDYQHDHLIHNTIKIYQMKYPEFNGAFSESSIRKIVIDKNALLELMFKQGYDFNCKVGWDNYTPLQYAVKHDDIDYLKVLLADPYVDRNIQNNDGETVLHVAVMFKKIEAIRLLSTDPKVDCHIRDNHGRIAYDYAKDSEIKELLSQRILFFYKYDRLTSVLAEILAVGVVILAVRVGIYIGSGIGEAIVCYSESIKF